MLGYLDADNFLGGARKLDRAASEAAVDRVAAALKLSREETAAGIFRLINLKMADGIRLMTVRRGVDPRRFALLSFGGAAGLHAVEVARELEIPRVIVPTVASVLSAWGMLATDLRYEISRTHIGEHAVVDDAAMRNDLRRPGGPRDGPAADPGSTAPLRIERSAEMRYGEQIFEIDVPLDGLDWNAPDLVSRIHERIPPPARGALHLRLARPGGGVRQRPRRRGRRRQLCGEASGRHGSQCRGQGQGHSRKPGSAAGARRRCSTWRVLRPALR